MKVRPRIADILLVLGLVALVTWSPTYFAQSTEERALLDGERFWLRDFQDGDRMDLELLVTWPNGTSYSSGPIVRVEYRTAGPHAPPGAVLEERRTFERSHVDLGGATVTLDLRNRTTWYDDDGVLLWTAANGIGDETVRHPSVPHASWPYGRTLDNASVERQGDWGTWDRLWANRSQPLWYDRASDLRSVLDLLHPDPAATDAETPVAEAAPAGTIEDQYRIQAIYRHGERSLYAANVQEYPWGPYPAPAFKEWIVGRHPFHIEVRFDEGIPRDGGMRHWDWYSRDFPAKVGLHQELFDAEGNPHVALDLVPAALHEGGHAVDEPAAAATNQPTATVPLRSWRDDTTPIVAGISAAAIASRVASDAAPDKVREFMAANAWIGGIAWFGDVDGDGRVVSDVDWVVLLVNDAGETHVVQLQSTDSGKWGQDASVRTLCGLDVVDVQGHEVRPACTPVDLSAGRARNVYGPAAWADLPTLAPARLADSGLRHLRDAGAGGFDRASLMVSLVPGFGATVDIPPDRGHGRTFETPVNLADRQALFLMMTNERRWTATTWFDDPALIRSEMVDWTLSPAELASSQPRIQGAVGEPLERTDLVGQTVGYGAAFLLVSGVLLRLVAALKGGLHLPLTAALYAKMTKDRSLDNERRQRLIALVDADPGVALADAARESRLHRTVAFHHLDTLRRNGLVHEVRLGRTRHYVPTHLDVNERVLRAALHHDAWRDVLEELELHPGIGVTELAHRLGRDKSRVSRVARRLEHYGLVRRQGSGAKLTLFPTARPNGAALLVTMPSVTA